MGHPGKIKDQDYAKIVIESHMKLPSRAEKWTAARFFIMVNVEKGCGDGQWQRGWGGRGGEGLRRREQQEQQEDVHPWSYLIKIL